MDDVAARALAAWATDAGLAGLPEPELLHGFCGCAVAAGLPLARATVLVDTLHPVYEGRVFRWCRDPTDLSTVVEYGRTEEDEEVAEKWRRSTFRHLLDTGGDILRRNLARGEPADFPT